jgi:predicted nucleic-acid-binding protein
VNVGLDTTVVLRLLTGEPEGQARAALAEVQARVRRGARLLVSDLVVSEAYFALQHHYGVPKDAALALLDRFLRESGVQGLGAAGRVLETPGLATARPGFVDRLIHAEYVHSAGEILTFEQAAGRLPAVRVLAEPRG